MESLQPEGLPVGFVGAGVMGAGMVRNLLAAGCRVTLHSRTRSRAELLLAEGATWAETPADAARDARAVITIVGFPADVRQVWQGSDGGEGILSAAAEGTVLVDMTTSEPTLARDLAEAAAARGAHALDAPVSGGDIGARDGTLSVMVGGDPEVFAAARPLLEVVGRTVVHQGPAGAGQHTKMCNQICIASGMIGVMEALLYARRAGLDPDTVLESIGSGAAASWSLSNLQPRAAAGDWDPGFYVAHFIKDMRIAEQEASDMGVDTPGLDTALDLYRELAETLDGGRQGTQALYRVLAARSGEAEA